MKDFVHLHNHSTYSFGDGISQIPNMVSKAKEMGMTALALTDHGYGHGLIEFHKECIKHSIKPILGCEFYITKRLILLSDRSELNKSANHLILLAKNLTGYKNLIKLLTIAATDGFYYKPKIDFETLTKYKEGLICLTACMSGPVNVHLYNSPKKNRVVDLTLAKSELSKFKDLFGEDLYFEIQFHSMKPEENNSLDYQSQIINFGSLVANNLDVQLVGTNDCHYVSHEDHVQRDIVMCNNMNMTVNTPDREIYDREGCYYLKSIKEMWDVFSSINPRAFYNTKVIAEKVEIYDPGLNTGNKMPKFSNDSDLIFKQKLLEGFKQKYPGQDKESEAYKRLMHEVKVIKTLGFVDYFLIVQDFINYAENNTISIGPGRGSAAGSIVSYCLNITTLCPIKNNLLFERFLNPGRKSLPDIDIDVCKNRRNDLINYVKNKYGHDYVSQIITFSSLKSKSSIKAVGRVLEVPYEVQDELTKSIPNDAGEFSVSLTQIVNEDSEAPKQAINSIKSFMNKSDFNKNFITNACKLEGTFTHSGVHAAAVVIGPQPLNEILPLQKSKDSIVTQYSMEDVEALGLLKMDFLGLDTLSVISDCLRSIAQKQPDGPLKNKGNILTLRNLSSIPELSEMDDVRVYRNIFSVGKTVGVFQCDSEGIRLLLARMKCNSFKDICAAISLYRPGPLDAKIADSFIKRKRKEEKEDIWHEKLKPYLSESYSLTIYQEQIMFASQVLCGFDMTKADELRKVIGKKKKEAIQAFRTDFLDGAKKTGLITQDHANMIYDKIEFFGRYAFNLSHSASYSVITYFTAWLKLYYPAYYMCSLLNKFVSNEEVESKKKNDDDLFLRYMLEAQTMGIKIQAPDINTSEVIFTPIDNKTISYGLGSLKGIGSNISNLINYRINNRSLRKFSDFLVACIDLDLNRTAAKSLIKAGVVHYADSEHLLTLFDGFMAEGVSGKMVKKTILDELRKVYKKVHSLRESNKNDEADTYLKESLNKLDSYIKDNNSNTPDVILIDPPGLYRILDV